MPVSRARASLLVSAFVLSLGWSALILAHPFGPARRAAGPSPAQAPEGACGPQNFTQNASLTPEPLTSIACIIQDGTDRHYDTSWWRAFRLADYGIAGDFAVCEVNMAIELADDGGGTGQPMTINLWLNSEECPFPGGTRTLLGTTTINVTDQSLTNLSVPVTGMVPALSEFAVEIAVPDGTEAGDVFFAGSNTAAQTRPTFVSSVACGLPNPTDLASIGFPDSHVIIQVFGTRGPVGPAGILVDEPGNKVVELGEPVAIETSYTNLTQADMTILGSKTDIFIPPPYTSGILDGTADFGLVPVGQTRSCADTGNCYSVQIDGTGFGHRDGFVEEALTLIPLTQGPSGVAAPTRVRTLHVGGSFADVPTSNIFYLFIETLLHNGVTGGCATADSYCPGDTTLRKQMAVFLLKSLLSSCYVPPPAAGIFNDVPAADPFAPWIEDLAGRGITGGCAAGLYCPNDPVKRKQMAVFLLKTLEGSAYTPPPGVGIFDDVPDDVFRPWIEDLYNRGITGGCAGGPPPAPISFCPENPVTRGQMSAFLSKTFDLLLYRP
jgi:S-layer homology domain